MSHDQQNGRWYLSFHGGSKKSAYNNIHTYSAAGEPLGKALNKDSLPKGVKLRELRGFAFGPDGHLYIVNAYKKYSQVVRFHGSLNDNNQHNFLDVFIEPDATANPGIQHPYALIFDQDNNILLSNQDTNIVLRYGGPTSAQPGQPMPIASAWSQHSGLYPGTFIPAETQASGGLSSVRDLAFGPDGHLYVADRDANAIKRYDGKTGASLGKLLLGNVELEEPIQLLWQQQTLYIGSSDTSAIVRYDLASGTTETAVSSGAGGLDHPSGLSIIGDGYLYVGSRKSKQVLRFALPAGTPDKRPFINELKDFPEFIQFVRPT